MSACEKCWRDAGGSMERYMELLAERESRPCTADEQSGRDYEAREDARIERERNREEMRDGSHYSGQSRYGEL